MKFIIGSFLSLLFSSGAIAQPVSLPNPIIFVAQVPIPLDSSTITATFSNHLPDPYFSGRGSDLYIIYPDGVLKNLTAAAGFGMSGLQGANAIGVRQPSVHWSGTKALFSMVIGAPTSQGEHLQYYWQIYEVTNLGENQTPVITKISNQPANYNNLSAIYGTDERIIFTSDRPRNGLAQLYPLLDERFSFVATTGLWSLDPMSGDLFQLNISPSGAFNPFIDSYGRIVFTKWDHLQRDPNADKDAFGAPHFGTFNYSDESANAIITSNRTEIFPEPEPNRTDLLKGTNINGLTFNQFFPWQINEDGTSEETLNHVGRHELLTAFKASINDDSNVTDFNYQTANRLNDSTLLQNLIQITEDPTKPGTYYGVNFSGFDQHSAAQIVSLTGDPSLDPSQMKFTYITDKTTVGSPSQGAPIDSNHSGHYRNPLPLSNGKLLVVHTAEAYADRNMGTRSNPISRYDLRIQTMKKKGSVWIADSLVTHGISKSISYWDPDTLVNYNGILWELDPVEVKARQKPVRRTSSLAAPEKQIFIEEGVDENAFRNNMKQNDLAMVVSRNITHRDKSDHQQPYFLKVHNSETQSADPHGKIYDASHLQLYQADQLRGLTLGNPLPIPGRRVLVQLMHDTAVTYNPPTIGELQHTVKIASDGSFAAFVPPRRAITWAITDSSFNAIIRERYWVTTQPGEIRVCASCHGTNDEALVHLDPPPQNKPEALRLLLQYWKSSHTPLSTELISPPNDSADIPINTALLWHSIPNAKNYQVTASSTQDFTDILFSSPTITDTTLVYQTNKPNTSFYWRVLSFNNSGDSAYSGIWKFTTTNSSVVAYDGLQKDLSLSNHPNPFTTETSIDFILPTSEAIKLKVFNLLGSEVATLANGIYGAGSHSIKWDAGNIPSGTYYYRLEAADRILAKQLQIIR